MENDRITIYKGDITELEVDAVVNAANSSLLGGGGVDGAIHKAAGPELHAECMDIVQERGRLPVGEAVITTAGNMKAEYVIHTVGPVWSGGKKDEEELLANAYRNSLTLALGSGCRTIAFPNISTGIYGFPKKKAAIVAIHEVAKFLLDHTQIDKVVFCCYDDENYHYYQEILSE